VNDTHVLSAGGNDRSIFQWKTSISDHTVQRHDEVVHHAPPQVVQKPEMVHGAPAAASHPGGGGVPQAEVDNMKKQIKKLQDELKHKDEEAEAKAAAFQKEIANLKRQLQEKKKNNESTTPKAAPAAYQGAILWSTGSPNADAQREISAQFPSIQIVPCQKVINKKHKKSQKNLTLFVNAKEPRLRGRIHASIVGLVGTPSGCYCDFHAEE
jgi:hypothetical protein